MIDKVQSTIGFDVIRPIDVALLKLGICSGKGGFEKIGKFIKNIGRLVCIGEVI